jgi:Ca2+-binding EF-hand superfamily protein
MDFQNYQLAQYNFGGNWEAEAVQVFQAHDRDRSGHIDMQEFPAVISQMAVKFNQPPPRVQDCWYLMNQYDSNKDGKLDINEFKNMCVALQKGTGTGTNLVRIFFG